MAGKRASNFLIGKVAIDGEASTSATVKISQSSTDNNVKLVAGTAMIGNVTDVPPTTGFSGQFTIGTGTVSEKVNGDAASGASQTLKRGVNITCKADSPGDLYVTIASATADITTTGTLVYRGTSIFIAIDDLAKVWVGGTAASCTGTYLGT